MDESDNELASSAAFNSWLNRVGDDLASSLISAEETEEMLRAVKRASSASGTSSAFHTAVARTGTDTYTALQTMVTWRNPSVSIAAEEGDLYGVPFIDTPAASPSGTRTDDADLRRSTGIRLRVVESGPEKTGAPIAPAHAPARGEEQEPRERYRLNDESVRELLMGTHLYQDRGVAIRELYQNALDALRYRTARYEYLRRRTGSSVRWQGGIEFVQGVDDRGRAFLDCVDNGIGMGEEELRTCFSRVGVRFASQPEFVRETSEWERCNPPVRMHPTSRFGIGVLSYFMLADEIEVTTCRMDQRGAAGPVMKLTVLGSGQTARISRVQAQGRAPGTRVRLFIRDEQNTPSCVDVLERLLCIADYTTTARHGTRSAVWEPHEWTRQMAPHHAHALNVRGRLMRTLKGQVVWCESGGALLVDGLLVQPSVRHGLLADSHGPNGLHGAVINLSGPSAPALSVDRKHIQDDVSTKVGFLVASAARELVSTRPDFVTDAWLDSLHGHSPRLAAIVKQAVSEA
ncbi:hypothetical protein [Streptomyces sp. Go-475]|uniref:hypothetical protein n=1 Tax=Streptomyces sp. Go-475 TaxID=2072505 RepID=UPI000DEFD0ED|nr:hypothetical protein [Streptomyces sp. Go-475]AXE84019.1 heat shock protein 90 [Streptomyces sp. Go-475]